MKLFAGKSDFGDGANAEKNTTRTDFKGYIVFAIIALVISVAISISYCPHCYTSWQGFLTVVDDVLYGFTLAMAIGLGLGYIEGRIQRHISWLKEPVKRLFAEVVIVTTYSFCVSVVILISFYFIKGYFTFPVVDWEVVLQGVKLPMLIAYVMTFFFTSRAFLTEWRQAAVHAEKLRTEQFAGQYRLLRDQLNPHFLFNSLNVLSNVIYEDQDKAADYVQQLARFYRYVLEVQNEEVVSLKKELEFGERYLYLQKLRFGANLIIENTVRVMEDEVVPPMSIQLCLENVLKHNAVSQAEPLRISLSRDGNLLIIQNQLNPRKTETKEGTGVGLQNIKQRYQLLSGEDVIVEQQLNTFTVKLPILKLGRI